MSIAELYEKYKGAEWWPDSLLYDHVEFKTVNCHWWLGCQGLDDSEAEALIFAALHHHCRAKGWNPDWVHAIPNLHSTTEGMRIYMSGDTDLARLIDAAEKANLL